MYHTITVVVENKFGVLGRVVGTFSGRGFNIDALNVTPMEDASTSRLTIVVRGNDKVLKQLIHHLEKLVNVISINDHQDGEYIDRELVLLRVCADTATRAEVIQICKIFRAKIIDIHLTRLTIEMTGRRDTIVKFLNLMEGFKIEALVRSGSVALSSTV